VLPRMLFSASFIICHQTLVKRKEPSCLTISIVIGYQLSHRALLDLMASANLFSFTKYEMLDKFKPSKMIIQLADRSTSCL